MWRLALVVIVLRVARQVRDAQHATLSRILKDVSALETCPHTSSDTTTHSHLLMEQVCLCLVVIASGPRAVYGSGRELLPVCILPPSDRGMGGIQLKLG